MVNSLSLRLLAGCLPSSHARHGPKRHFASIGEYVARNAGL
jgi:hypothetical protein